MIKAIIFDLDNCLAAADEVDEDLYEPAFSAIRRANTALTDDALERAFADCWRHPLDWVAKEHGFTDEMLDAGWREFARVEVERPMKGYGDLASLESLRARRFLVTSGFRRLQESKIRALNLKSFFDAVYVDAIDEPDRKGKQGLFEDILNEQQLSADEVLIVGDNEASEIAVGARMGIKTVQTLRPGVPRTETATFHVRSLDELRNLVR